METMETASLIGISLYVLGGLTGAVFYLPFKKVQNWAWESYWMIYAVVGLLIMPWAMALSLSPNVFSVLKATFQESPRTLLWCYLFGAMWGLGGLTWGLMIRYLGVGLGLAVGAGLCASAGTLIPPVVRGELPTLMAASWGIATLVGVGVALLGIVTTGAAGMSKERELSEEQKKATVAEFDFNKGILVAIFSGIMSAGMAFGLGGGRFIEKAALVTDPKTDPLWQGMPVLVVVLLGGFTVNFLWCLFLNVKNRTGGDYLKAGAPLVGNLLFAGAAGAIWCSQFVLYKVADAKSGDKAFAGWTVFMSSMIIFSTLLAILMKEWKGTSGRTKSLLTASLLILVAALVTIGYGNYLKPETTKGAIVQVGPAKLVIQTEDAEKDIPLDDKAVVLIEGKEGKLADLKVQQQVQVTQSRVAPLRIETPPPAEAARR
jgi:L-rhamnose-H+ transport protein